MACVAILYAIFFLGEFCFKGLVHPKLFSTFWKESNMLKPPAAATTDLNLSMGISSLGIQALPPPIFGFRPSKNFLCMWKNAV